MTTTVMRNGSRLTPFMLHEIERLNRDLKARFGCEVIVTSGIRLHQEQIDVFLARYVTAGNIRGRKVYDTRVWKGIRYYRISSAGTVASPGTSNHEIQGSKAAVDLRDTGRDAGLTVRGSERSNWLKANASSYSMIASGFGFGEAWHYDMINIFGSVPGSGGQGRGGYADGSADLGDFQEKLIEMGHNLGKTGADKKFGPLTEKATLHEQKMAEKNGYPGGNVVDDGIPGPSTEAYLDWWIAGRPAPAGGNPFGIPSVEGLQKIAKLYGYKGKIDNIWGDGSAAGFAEFLRRNHSYRGNDTLGPVMWAAIARWLRKPHSYGSYVGNDTPGPVMRAALKRAEEANEREL